MIQGTDMMGNAKKGKILMKLPQEIFAESIYPEWKFLLFDGNNYIPESREENNPAKNMHSLCSK